MRHLKVKRVEGVGDKLHVYLHKTSGHWSATVTVVMEYDADIAHWVRHCESTGVTLDFDEEQGTLYPLPDVG
jgi:hypothetical protein